MNVAKILAPLAALACLGAASATAADADNGEGFGREEQSFLHLLSQIGFTWTDAAATVRVGHDVCDGLAAASSENDEALTLQRANPAVFTPQTAQHFVIAAESALCPPGFGGGR